MICMIGKDTRRRAFASAIAAGALLIALIIALAAIVPAALRLGWKKDGDASSSEDAESVLKNGGVSLYDPARDGEVIRLHIVANSDSSEDQRVKMLVRNEVLALAHLGDDILELDSAQDAESVLKRFAQPILSTVRSVLRRERVEYDAQLILGDFDFPDREYDGKLYPAGKYRALRILLGGAQGKNWWCILFPPLCIIKTDEQIKSPQQDASVPAVEQSGAIRFESLLVRLFNTIFYGGE